jgi:hypothetical protein
MIPKPGKPKKKKQKMPKPPSDTYCRYLGWTTGTERWCHDESRIGKMKHGGGITGGRIPHSKTAWISDFADKILSKPLPKDATQEELEEHAAEWDRLIELSH